GDRLEHELARDRARGLGAEALLHLTDALTGQLQVGLRADAAARERADEAALELACPRVDERPAGMHVCGVDERVGDGGAERRLDLELELRADARLDVGAQV